MLRRWHCRPDGELHNYHPHLIHRGLGGQGAIIGRWLQRQVVCCRHLIQHRADACVTLINKAVTTSPRLGAALSASAARRYGGPQRVAVIYIYIPKLHGEAQHKPHIRLPPLSADAGQKMLKGCPCYVA